MTHPRYNPFPEPLHFDNAGMILGKRNIVLTRDFPCVTSRGLIIAPAGLVIDGASIPKIAQSIVGHPFDVFLEECVIHDLGYSPLNDRFSRREVDLIFKETMWNRRDQISTFKRESLFMAVHIFGGKHFKGKIK